MTYDLWRPLSSRPFLTTLPASHCGSNPNRLLDPGQPVQRINAPPTINWLSDFWSSNNEKMVLCFSVRCCVIKISHEASTTEAMFRQKLSAV